MPSPRERASAVAGMPQAPSLLATTIMQHNHKESTLDIKSNFFADATPLKLKKRTYRQYHAAYLAKLPNM
jgi:hypothetical protein